MKRQLTYTALVILVVSALLHWTSDNYLISAVNPVLYFLVCAIGMASCVWLAWRLYSDNGIGYKIVGTMLLVPVSAVLGFLFFDGVASQVVLLSRWRNLIVRLVADTFISSFKSRHHSK